MGEKICSFKDLHAWQEAHKLTLVIYKMTQRFQKEEIFGLTNQIRRSAVSVEANIAECFSRRSSKEKTNFFHISLGSATETESHCLVAKDLGYIPLDSWPVIERQIVTVNKLCNGLIKSACALN
jgi:four helix bundle protein